MPTYEVDLDVEVTGILHVKVEADSEEEAQFIAESECDITQHMSELEEPQLEALGAREL